MIKLVVAGSKGRMGQMIMQMAMNDDKRRFGPVLGFDKGDDSSMIAQGDVIVDFTVPQATIEHLKAARSAKKPIVIGTTGLSSTDMAVIGQTAMDIPIVQSSNMSLGMNVLFRISQIVAKYLGPKQIKIIEKHHVHKKDAPSGSALTLKEYILDPKSNWNGPVPIESIREGEIVGEHAVIETGWFEQLELIHKAQSRAPFAAGALIAAKWVVPQKPGLYSMQDVLGLNDA